MFFFNRRDILQLLVCTNGIFAKLLGLNKSIDREIKRVLHEWPLLKTLNIQLGQHEDLVLYERMIRFTHAWSENVCVVFGEAGPNNPRYNQYNEFIDIIRTGSMHKMFKLQLCRAPDVSGTLNLGFMQETLFVNLRELDLVNCQMHTIDRLGNMCLKTLKISGCDNLLHVPGALSTSLTSLTLDMCRSIDNIPAIPSLSTLDMRRMEFVNLPDNVLTMTNITNLCLDRCGELLALPNGLTTLANLKTLSAIAGNFTALPTNFYMLTSLLDLDFGGCSELTAPDIQLIMQLTSLTMLNLGDIDLTTLPEQLGNLTRLRTLRLFHCALTDLPDSIGCLLQLRELDVCDNCLRQLPRSIVHLTALRKLKVGENQFARRGMTPVVGQLTSLTSLECTDSEDMTRLPNTIGNLLFLETLCLAGCTDLKNIPNAIRYLTGLKTLNCLNCMYLRGLPRGITQLVSLADLSLEECSNLLKLPHNFSMLTGLTELNMNMCESLLTLPAGFVTMTSLTRLSMESCSGLIELPTGLDAMLGVDDIHDYLGVSPLDSLVDHFFADNHFI